MYAHVCNLSLGAPHGATTVRAVSTVQKTSVKRQLKIEISKRLSLKYLHVCLYRTQYVTKYQSEACHLCVIHCLTIPPLKNKMRA